jgi:penicillin G amidase
MSRKRKALWLAAAIAGLVLVLALTGYTLLTLSQPMLDGQTKVVDLTAAVRIERDALGIATITADNRLDLAFATGYAHGQDRLFQMDLLRRTGAGELAQLLGPSALEHDKRLRRHGFRQVAEQVLARASDDERQLLAAYASGDRSNIYCCAPSPRAGNRSIVC